MGDGIKVMRKMNYCLLLVVCFLLLSPGMTAKAGEKLNKYRCDFNVKVEGTHDIPPGQYGYFEIANEDYLQAEMGNNLTYEWYVSHENVVDDYGWYKIEKDCNWLYQADTKKLLIYLSPGFHETEEKYYMFCCVIRNDKGKVCRTTENTFRSNGEVVKQVSLLSSTGNIQAVYGEKLDFQFRKEVEDAPYKLGARVKKNGNNQVDPGQGVQWFQWDFDNSTWVSRHAGACFEEGTYKLNLTVCADAGAMFDPGLVNGTKCFVDNKSVERGFSAYNYSEMSMTKIFHVQKEDQPRIITLKELTDYYATASSPAPMGRFPAGTEVKIIEFTDSRMHVTTFDGEEGWLENSDIYDDLENHCYVCISSALNVRKSPDKTSERVTALKYGDIVYAEEGHNGWMKIRREKETAVLGWVNGEYMTLSPGKEYAITPKRGHVTANAVNIRSDADISASRIGGLSKEYAIIVTGRKMDAENKPWLIFAYNNHLGYVMEQYVEPEDLKSFEDETTVAHIPLGIPSSISTMSVKHIFSGVPETVIHIDDVKMDTANKDIVFFTITPEDGYSFPSDVSKIKIDLGADPEFSLIKIEQQKDGSIKVYLKELNYCSKHGHVPKTAFTVDKASSCTAQGSKSRHCSICNAKTNVTAIPKAAHSYSKKYTKDRKATIDRAGSKSKHCVKCGKKSAVTSIPRIKKYTIYVGQKVKLPTSAKGKKWKSSQKKIVSVTSGGTIKGKKKGKATISVVVKGKTYKCKITVKSCKK